MKVDLVKVSPVEAAEMLKFNTMNRNLKKDVVNLYAEEMRLGKWKERTGEPIKLNLKGELLDGQHRLAAVIKSGVSIEFMVVSELDSDILPVLDTGRNRSANDIFVINSIKNSSSICAGVRTYITLNSGIYSPGKSSGSTKQKLSTTNSELLKAYKNNVDFWQNSHNFSIHMYKAFNGVLSGSQILGIYAHLYDIDKVMAKDFIYQLCTGTEITNKTILIARNVLIKNKLSVKKMTIYYQLIYIFKAWNYFRNGLEVKFIRFDPDAEFPKPI